jgi:hypothetical protein
MNISLFAILALVFSNVIFYYPPFKKLGPALLNNMKESVERTRAKSREKIARDENGTQLRSSVEIALGAALFSMVQKISLGGAVDISCRQYELQLANPCVVVSYDYSSDMCKFVYRCNTLDIGHGQKAVAPVTHDGARHQHGKLILQTKNSNPVPKKIKYL